MAPPLFYNDLAHSLAEARALLGSGASDRRSAAHTPVVASLTADGTPTQRVMILRALDWEGRRLRFHTDPRSGKAAQLAEHSAVSVLVYDPEPKIQLRLSGTAQLITEGAEADAAWQSSTLFARRCYLAEQAPGSVSDRPLSGLPSWVEGRSPTEAEVVPARANFAILSFNFDRIEWLYLANAGHRRARWQWDSVVGDWIGDWLVP